MAESGSANISVVEEDGAVVSQYFVNMSEKEDPTVVEVECNDNEAQEMMNPVVSDDRNVPEQQEEGLNEEHAEEITSSRKVDWVLMKHRKQLAVNVEKRTEYVTECIGIRNSMLRQLATVTSERDALSAQVEDLRSRLKAAEEALVREENVSRSARLDYRILENAFVRETNQHTIALGEEFKFIEKSRRIFRPGFERNCEENVTGAGDVVRKRASSTSGDGPQVKRADLDTIPHAPCSSTEDRGGTEGTLASSHSNGQEKMVAKEAQYEVVQDLSALPSVMLKYNDPLVPQTVRLDEDVKIVWLSPDALFVAILVTDNTVGVYARVDSTGVYRIFQSIAIADSGIVKCYCKNKDMSIVGIALGDTGNLIFYVFLGEKQVSAYRVLGGDVVPRICNGGFAVWSAGHIDLHMFKDDNTATIQAWSTRDLTHMRPVEKDEWDISEDGTVVWLRRSKKRPNATLRMKRVHEDVVSFSETIKAGKLHVSSDGKTVAIFNENLLIYRLDSNRAVETLRFSYTSPILYAQWTEDVLVAGDSNSISTVELGSDKLRRAKWNKKFDSIGCYRDDDKCLVFVMNNGGTMASPKLAWTTESVV